MNTKKKTRHCFDSVNNCPKRRHCFRPRPCQSSGHGNEAIQVGGGPAQACPPRHPPPLPAWSAAIRESVDLNATTVNRQPSTAKKQAHAHAARHQHHMPTTCHANITTNDRLSSYWFFQGNHLSVFLTSTRSYFGLPRQFNSIRPIHLDQPETRPRLVVEPSTRVSHEVAFRHRQPSKGPESPSFAG